MADPSGILRKLQLQLQRSQAPDPTEQMPPLPEFAHQGTMVSNKAPLGRAQN